MTHNSAVTLSLLRPDSSTRQLTHFPFLVVAAVVAAVPAAAVAAVLAAVSVI